MNCHSWSTIFQSSTRGVTVAWCTYSKCALSGAFSATICGWTGSRSARRGESRDGRVIGGRIGLESRELAKDVRHFPLRLLAIGLMPDEHAVVLLADGVHPQPQYL